MNYESLWQRLMPLYDAGEAKAIVRWVLDERFHLSQADILCGKVTELSADDQAELEKIMLRLEKGEPMQYVMGNTTFCRRNFHVTSDVLIPRPETEELCNLITSCPTQKNHTSVLDIGTGSGCIAITLALDIPGAQVTAWDISLAALDIARDNAAALQAPVTFEIHDALMPEDDGRQWDIIVSNPPYILPEERDEMADNVLRYEPEVALFVPEENPIIFYQRIANYATNHLAPEGILYFELNPLTADDVCDYLRRLGFMQIELMQDQFGKTRFLKAKYI